MNDELDGGEPLYNAPVYGESVPVTDIEPEAPVRRTRTGWIIASAIAVVLIVVAIGGVIATRSGSSSKSTVAVFKNAVNKTTGSSYHMELDSSLDLGAGDGEQSFLTARGDIDKDRHLSEIDMSARGQTIMRIRGVGDTTYASSPFAHLPGGAEWVALRKDDIKIDKGAEAALSQGDATQGLQFFNAYNGNPTVVGHEKIDGIDVTHYAFTINLEQMLEAEQKAGKQLGAQLAQVEKVKQYVDLQHLPAEAWIDNEGRVRRFRYKLNIDAQGQHASSTATLDFSKFGETVDVSAPPSSDAVPFSQARDFFSQLGQAGGSTG